MKYRVKSSFIDSKQKRLSPGDVISDGDYPESTIKHYLGHSMIETPNIEKASAKPKSNKATKPKSNKAIKPEANK